MQIADLGEEARFDPHAIQAYTSYFTVKDVFAGNHGVIIKRLLEKCWATPTKPIASHITGMEEKKMDYSKEMIEYFRSLADRWEDSKQLLLSGELDLPYALRDAATAIETLLAEREKSVKVVRCKDCENYILTGRPPFMYHACTRLGAIRTVDEDDFCKYGTPPDRQQSESKREKPKEIYNDGKYRVVTVVE